MAYFAFNPIYQTLSGSGKKSIIISDGTTSFSFDVMVHGASAKLYLSRYFQLLFKQPETERHKASVSVSVNGTVTTYNHVIWGSIDQNQINDNDKKHVRKFANYPFVCEVFNGSGFSSLNATSNTIVVQQDASAEGYYLRWVDNMGQRFAWLFRSGTEAEKVSDGDVIEQDPITIGGYQLQVSRNISKNAEKTIKCGAVNLTKDELKVVKSIAKSMVVDYYLGGTWIPCRISAGSYSINEREDLYEFEITAIIPDGQPQAL